MARIMKIGAAVSVALTVLFGLVGITPLAITAGTFAYHLLMRLAVGLVFDKALNNHVDYRRGWFRLRSFEPRLYGWLRVAQWKTGMPTYDPEAFDRHKHTWDEIAQAMCQAELVHEVIVVLSFMPLVASIWLGEMPVFLITSLLAAGFDLMFVVMQRYNRPRILKIVDRLNARG